VIKKIETISKLFYYALKCGENPHIVPYFIYIEEGELFGIRVHIDPIEFWRYYQISYKRFKDEESVIAGNAGK